MDPAPHPEALPARNAQDQAPQASAGVQRHVWHSAYGPMLIEVVGERTYVNGELVEPAPS